LLWSKEYLMPSTRLMKLATLRERIAQEGGYEASCAFEEALPYLDATGSTDPDRNYKRKILARNCAGESSKHLSELELVAFYGQQFPSTLTYAKLSFSMPMELYDITGLDDTVLPVQECAPHSDIACTLSIRLPNGAETEVFAFITDGKVVSPGYTDFYVRNKAIRKA